MSHAILITGPNPALADLKLSWSTMEFSAEDGLGSMASLHQAGDALVAVAELTDAGLTVHGSGVMVAPGLLLTATHVLDQFPRSGSGPVFMTFLAEGARAWLPQDAATVSGPSRYYEDRKVVSDISLVSCTLNSDAQVDLPLTLAPMKIALPLIGQRLWAFGFRHHGIEDRAALVTPLVSSGLVTAAFPHGRGERLGSACFEVALESLGGMSGGAVVNGDGGLIGIVSASVENGPSIITLIWEALRFRVKGTVPRLQRDETVSLLGANAFGLARLKGDVNRNPWGEVRMRLSPEENNLLIASAGPAPGLAGIPGLSNAEREVFVADWGMTLEQLGSDAVIEELGRFSLERVRSVLSDMGIPWALLASIDDYYVEDLEGVEDLEIVSTSGAPDGRIGVDFYFRMQTLVWKLGHARARLPGGRCGDGRVFPQSRRQQRDCAGGVLSTRLVSRRGRV